MKLKSPQIFRSSRRESRKLPFLLARIPAGFPSPAEDYVENKLDLNDLLIKHPSATFFIRVQGDSMINAGIFSNDILIVDKSLEPHHDNVVVAVLNGEFTVKRLKKVAQRCFLLSENPDYPSVEVNSDDDCEIWGVVTSVIHKP